MATVIASVVPEANFNLVRLCQRYCGSDPLMVGRSDCLLGIGLARRHAEEEVGADRVANAVAAHDRYQPPLIVLDFGTATTFDVVDRDGQLLRRGDCPRHQSVAAGARHGGGEAAAYRDPAPAETVVGTAPSRPCSPASSGAMSG